MQIQRGAHCQRQVAFFFRTLSYALFKLVCCLWALCYVLAFPHRWQMTTLNLSFALINLSGNYSRYQRPLMTWRLTLRLMTASSFASSIPRNQSYEKLEKYLKEFTDENSTNVLVKPDLKTRGFSKEWVLEGWSTFKMNYKIIFLCPFVPFCAYIYDYDFLHAIWHNSLLTCFIDVLSTLNNLLQIIRAK